MTERAPETDVFVSHATEDKAHVKQLADSLIRLGVSVWYDDYELNVGDSIRGQINRGLRESRYGILVLSPAFFAKRWPQQELAALAALATEAGSLLPVLLGITHREVALAEPLLADVYTLDLKEEGTRRVASKIAAKVLTRSPYEVSQGRRTVRHKSVRLVDFPRDHDDVVRDVLFEDCLLQGPAVIIFRNNPTLDEIVFNGPETFWKIENDRGYVGAIGFDNVAMVRCRFKDVGICMSEPWYSQMLELPTLDGPPPWTRLQR